MQLPLTENNLVVGALVVGLFGIVVCFFGYRIFRLLLAVLGFIVGAGIAVAIVNSHDATTVLLVGLIGGLIGALIFYFLYIVGAFVAGLELGVTFGAVLAASFNLGTNATVLVILVTAIVGGILGIALAKYVIMLSTAFTGAAQIVYATLILFPNLGLVHYTSRGVLQFSTTGSPTITLVILILAAIGFVVQLSSDQRSMLPTYG